jgi:polysaccharide biosynthesis protein PslH
VTIIFMMVGAEWTRGERREPSYTITQAPTFPLPLDYRPTSKTLNVLFLTHRLPYAPNRGDRVRAYFLLQELRRHAHVTVVSLVHDDEEASHVCDLAGIASAVYVARVPRLRNLARSFLALPTARPTTHSMLDAPGLRSAIRDAVAAAPPDVVFAYCSGVAPYAMQPPLANCPWLLDMVDVDSEKWAQMAAIAAPPLSWIYRREARTLRAFEAVAATRAVATLITTPNEATALRAIAPNGRIRVVQNGVDLASLTPPAPPSSSSDVVFCGVMNYAPNVQAALWLAREIWPLVRQRRPDATLTIVGSQPTRAVRDLADPAQGITVTGAVPDVRPYLWRAAVAAAPIRTARGIQNKVLEAVAAGLPTVVTPNILASLPDTIAGACLAGDTPETLAAAIADLLARSPDERRIMARRADVASLSWERQLADVPALLHQAAERRA